MVLLLVPMIHPSANPNPNPNLNPAVDLPFVVAGWLVEIYYYMTEGGRGAHACWFCSSVALVPLVPSTFIQFN
jgi:hypothetical protein